MSAAGRLASSRSRTGTPTRAITSTLLTRSSPSIPSASEAFDPHLKPVLRHRLLYNIFGYSLFFSWIQSALWLAWSRGGLSTIGLGGVLITPILPITLVFACLNWFIGAFPIIILRKVGLTATRTPAPSPSQIWQTAMSKPSTLRALLTYTISSTLLMTSHIWMASAFESANPRLTVFVRSKKHPYYLNGRFLFLLVSELTLSCGLLLRNILLDRFVFRWVAAPSSVPCKWPFRISELAKVSSTIVLFTFICTCASALVFAITRTMLPLLFKIPILPFILRPFATHFLHGPWTISLPILHFSLVIRSFFLSLTTFSMLEFSELLFESFVVQPTRIASKTADPFLTLVSGISSPDACFKYFAYSELRKLAKDQSSIGIARRTAMFGDTKYTPNLWSHLLREGLLFLGRDYQLFLNKGKPSSPVVTTIAPPVVPPPVLSPGTPTQLLKTSVYKSTRQSPIHTVLDSFAADGSFSQAIEAKVGATHIPQLFRSVEILRPVTSVPGTNVVAKQAVGLFTQWMDHGKSTFGGLMKRCTPPWILWVLDRWTTWWTRERVNKKVEACLPNREIDVLVIEVISRLTCTSLMEDRYGVVQRDIPRILEAFVSFLSAMETYQAEINAIYKSPPSNELLSVKDAEEKELLRFEAEKAGEVLDLVGAVLKEGVMRIGRTFGDKLLAFKFPPRIARNLQPFVDHS